MIKVLFQFCTNAPALVCQCDIADFKVIFCIWPVEALKKLNSAQEGALKIHVVKVGWCRNFQGGVAPFFQLSARIIRGSEGLNHNCTKKQTMKPEKI